MAHMLCPLCSATSPAGATDCVRCHSAGQVCANPLIPMTQRKLLDGLVEVDSIAYVQTLFARAVAPAVSTPVC